MQMRNRLTTKTVTSHWPTTLRGRSETVLQVVEVAEVASRRTPGRTHPGALT